MSKLRFAALALVVIATISLVILYILSRRLPPTTFNWTPNVSTIAGDGSPTYRDRVQALTAAFSDPFGLAVAPNGTIYIADAGESNRIRKLTAEGSLSIFAGSDEGYADGAPGSFNTPSGLALDSAGNLYVADTGNNRIRKISPEGVVSTLAGSGTAGYVDGPATVAQFNGPVGVAVDTDGNVYVADTYNDRIRKISIDGEVSTVAGSESGYVDGTGSAAQFNTPCAVVVQKGGTLIVADTGNNKLRRITSAGQVTTVPISFIDDPSRSWLRSPVGLSQTHDGFLYVSEFERGTIVQVAPDGKACVLAGSGSGYANGLGAETRFNHPAAVAIDQKTGDLVVADAANYLVRRLSHTTIATPITNQELPILTRQTLEISTLLWPLDPQDQPHEVAATMGEVRGRFDSTDSRDHLHSGLDVAGAYGQIVRAIRSEKVTSPIPNWGFGDLSEGLRVGVFSYVHMQVGRNKDGNIFDDSRFMAVKNRDGKLEYMRVKRGTRFRPGDAIGTINRMYHVHLIVGPSGGEINPLFLGPVGFKDTIAPTFEKDGIHLFDESGSRLNQLDRGRLIVSGRVRIVVDAFDRSDMNGDRRRLGVYSLGYQLLKDRSSNTAPALAAAPAPGFPAPRINILFNRLPADENGVKLAYAEESGITVYGSKTTRFLYELTNVVRDGQARQGWWDTTELSKGDYILRIIAADFSGNETHQDVLITIQ